VARRELDLRAWVEEGRRLGLIGRGVAWWLGDWLRYGNERYGERYSRASRITGYDRQTLMNMAYVASRFAPDRRRERLSWSHHADLAGVSAEEQEHWLDLAEADGLSVRCLREAIRAADKGDKRVLDGSAPKGLAARGAQEVVCPNCRHVIDVHSSP
jgi:hypothetical protein